MAKNVNSKIIRVVLLAVSFLALVIMTAVSKPESMIFLKTILLFLDYIILLTMLGKNEHVVKVILVTMLFFVLCSWFIPTAYFQTEYASQGRTQMGLFDLFSYPMTAIQYFGYVALFLLAVGGFYGVLNKIPAYRKLLDSMAKCLGKNGKLSISIIMVLLAVITSICGLQIGLMIFVPFLVSLILLMGYDKMVAALTVVGSTMIGIAGTLFGFSNVSTILSSLSVKIVSNWYVKLIILVVGLAILIINTILYINRIGQKKSTAKKVAKTSKTTKSTKSTKSASKSESVKKVKEESQEDTMLDDYVPKAVTGKHSIMPLIVVFAIMFIIMILAFISWSNAFNNSAFEKATTEVTTNFKIFGFPLFGKILGKVNAFGAWTLIDLVALLAISTGLLIIIYKVKFDDGLDAFVEGAKKAIKPAVMVILIYTCLVIVTYHPYQLTIYKALFGLGGGFNVFTSILAAMFASVFNADPLYVFQSVLPYLASISSKGDYSTIAVIYQAMYGLSMLAAPTSLVLMIMLSYLKISYKDWLKNIWKLLLELFILFLIIFIVIALI